MFASGYLNVNILKDFFFKSTIGIDVTDSREGIYKDKNTVANLGVKSTSSVQADNDWRYTWGEYTELLQNIWETWTNCNDW